MFILENVKKRKEEQEEKDIGHDQELKDNRFIKLMEESMI